jgi:DNA polymerase III subunit chi
MTAIDFHVNAPDKVGFTCRLLRKAVGKGAKLVVTGEPELLRELDVALWTFSQLDFVPHCYGQAAGPSVLAASPVVLADSAREAPHQQVLVNLGGQVPDGFERYELLIEVVTTAEDDLQQGRRRWKYYADRGYALVKHDQAVRGAS